MSKILSYYFKRDKWILLAIALISALGSFVLMRDMGPIINFLILNLVLIVGPLLLMVRDYKRFYGEYSSFFNGLPLRGKDIIGARFIWFTVVDLYSLLIVGLKGLEFLLRILQKNPNFQEITRAFEQIYAQTGAKIFVVMSLCAMAGLICTTATWLFVTSVGSEKPFRRFGIGGPIILFVVVQIVFGIISNLVGAVSSHYFADFRNFSNTMAGKEVIQAVSGVFLSTAGSLAVVMIICAIIFIWRSIYSHDKKLSAL